MEKINENRMVIEKKTSWIFASLALQKNHEIGFLKSRNYQFIEVDKNYKKFKTKSYNFFFDFTKFLT